ncbi:MAG: hypothetical protein GY843_03000 [Neptuniibacter sp.]|nr:hypothetical protein [Neptuniibacter sp.]
MCSCEDEILYLDGVSEITGIPVSTLRTNHSRRPWDSPPFFKLGGAKNSPLVIRKSALWKWVKEQEEKQQQRVEELKLQRGKPDLSALLESSSRK